jgi:hypothetical protein
MKESDSGNRVTPYQLAMLAARIWPRICVQSPSKAIAAAERLLQAAEGAIDRANQEGRRKEWEIEEAQMRRKDWVVAVKHITGQQRRDRAEERFRKFMEHQLPGTSKQQLNAYKRERFTDEEIYFLRQHFIDWQKEPKRKKGKQGRRLSDSDSRLRTDLLGLFPRKPRKRS